MLLHDRILGIFSKNLFHRRPQLIFTSAATNESRDSFWKADAFNSKWRRLVCRSGRQPTAQLAAPFGLFGMAVSGNTSISMWIINTQ